MQRQDRIWLYAIAADQLQIGGDAQFAAPVTVMDFSHAEGDRLSVSIGAVQVFRGELEGLLSGPRLRFPPGIERAFRADYAERWRSAIDCRTWADQRT